ncbi:DUF551 domain-containing protein [Phytobacter ursingii]
MKDETLLTDEQAAFEKFMEENFRDSIDRRHVKNGDGGYFAWDMVVAWVVWQGRAALHSGNSGQVLAGLVAAVNRLLDSDGSRGCYDAMVRGEARDEIERLLAAAPAVSDGWIPVSERLPENKPGCFEYIVFDSLNNRAHHDYWNVPDPGDDAFTPFWNHYGQYVTHWQPLPDAPKVKP